MVADRPPTRENRSVTCGFSHSRVAPGMSGATLSCPAGTGKHRPTTAGCAEYVPKFGEMLRGHSLRAPDVTHGGRRQAGLPDHEHPCPAHPDPGMLTVAASAGAGSAWLHSLAPGLPSRKVTAQPWCRAQVTAQLNG